MSYPMHTEHCGLDVPFKITFTIKIKNNKICIFLKLKPIRISRWFIYTRLSVVPRSCGKNSKWKNRLLLKVRLYLFFFRIRSTENIYILFLYGHKCIYSAYEYVEVEYVVKAIDRRLAKRLTCFSANLIRYVEIAELVIFSVSYSIWIL